ncbi:MAG TPA: zinc ABC transporter substrate-binding protein [Solirubrobacteraceae bacterium]|nr:zinc ABC transporter substrate-binding protein [Solirubrobacteraceae bacterium]
MSRWVLLGVVAAVVVAGCGRATPLARVGHGSIAAVGAESQYANVIAQIGGRYVTVTAIESNPSTDPHAFEASPSVAEAISSARIVVQNGLGYDTFMNRIESASPSRSRRVIDVQRLLGLPDSTPNPHLWYAPWTMPAVARRLVADLSAIAPAHAAYFAANARRFDAALAPWRRALRTFAARHPRTPVASTEPVSDYLLQAAGTVNLAPLDLRTDVMNGVDPAPQLVTRQTDLLAHRRVRALVYNQQVTDTLTQSFLQTATSHHVPVVGVDETMPAGYDYQSWMVAETRALERAVVDGVSTGRPT